MSLIDLLLKAGARQAPLFLSNARFYFLKPLEKWARTCLKINVVLKNNEAKLLTIRIVTVISLP